MRTLLWLTVHLQEGPASALVGEKVKVDAPPKAGKSKQQKEQKKGDAASK